MRVLRSTPLLLGLALIAVGSGCHREVEDVPLISRMINISDRFYDVQAIDKAHAIVVGYGGKILMTSDGGFTWTRMPSGTNQALYRVRFVDANTGWIAGQSGLILHTADGGKTWQRQDSKTSVYLFSLYFTDANNGWAIGDKSILTETHDGGATWTLRKVTTAPSRKISEEEAIAAADPVLYDIQFLDQNMGWVVGEFGKIFHTTDGGHTWSEQQDSLLGGNIVDPLDLPTFYGVKMTDAENGIASGLDGKIARTRDGGATWKFQPMQLDRPIIDPLFTPFLFADGTGWSIGAAGEVVRLATADGQWQRAKLGMEVVTWLRGMHWLDKTEGWIVGGYGLILHTKDGGQTWIPSLG